MRPFLQRVQSIIRQYPWKAFVAAWGTLITGEWTAAGLRGETLFAEWAFVREWVPFLIDSPWVSNVLAVALFVGSFVWLYHLRGAFLLTRTLSRRLAEPRPCLLLLVSPQNADPISDPPVFPLVVRKNGAAARLEGKDLHADIESLNALAKWNWQQLLRAAQPHVSILRRIHLIGSPGSKGSFQQLSLCKALLERYLPDAMIRLAPKPVDFEDFDALAECIALIIREEKAEGTRERAITIDVTGGVKTASIAAASVTLNNQVTFQYVQTFEPYEVYAYDVIHQPPPSHEEH